MYYKTIISFGFCDIHNNQGYQPSASAHNLYLNLDYYGISKTLCNDYNYTRHRFLLTLSSLRVIDILFLLTV